MISLCRRDDQQTVTRRLRLTVSVSAGKFSVDLVKSLNWVSVCFQFWFIDNIDMYVQLNTGAKTSTSGKKNLGKNECRTHTRELHNDTKLDNKILMPKLPCNASGFLSLIPLTQRGTESQWKCQINEKKTQAGAPTFCVNKQIYYTFPFLPRIYFSGLCRRWSFSVGGWECVPRMDFGRVHTI